MIWLDRILSTECPDCAPLGLGGKPGRPCDTAEYHWGRKVPMFCTSRIQAAEGASRTHRFMHKPGPGQWGYNVYRCVCGTWRTWNGDTEANVYAFEERPRCPPDNGATWTPGPSVCPGKEPRR